MLKNEGHGFRVQTHIDGIQYPAHHWHCKMHLEHFCCVGAENGHRIALAQTALSQSGCHALAALKDLAPIQNPIVLYDSGLIWINPRGATQQ